MFSSYDRIFDSEELKNMLDKEENLRNLKISYQKLKELRDSL